MPDISLCPEFRPVDAVVHPPGSKSQSNRALVLAAMADGVSRIDDLLEADDTRLMVAALQGLGVAVDWDTATRRSTVRGCGARWPNDDVTLECGNAGTVARFLTAACTLGVGDYEIVGSPRMRERPLRPLVDSLNDLGASVLLANGEGLPVHVAARGLRGGTTELRADASSQFLSALLMAAPLSRGDVMISLPTAPTSAPFVRMTLSMIEQFGAACVADGMERFVVPGMQHYRAQETRIEPDATAASYFFAAAAVTGGRISVPGLGRASLQGDLGFLDVLKRMGCEVRIVAREASVVGPADGRLRGVDEDLGGMPDVAQTLAVLALFAEGPTRIRNVANLRLKETDRQAALAAELQKLGAEIELHDDGLTIVPPKTLRAAAIDTYGDHRMAMSFAIAGLRLDGIIIRDADCVRKTYPDFFADWERMLARST